MARRLDSRQRVLPSRQSLEAPSGRSAGVPVTMVASSSAAQLPILALDGGMQSSLLRNSHLLHARIACRHCLRARAQQGLGVRPPLMVLALACVRRPATGL
eukprot:4362299-Pleurochrysis_carterae.AAC.1